MWKNENNRETKFQTSGSRRQFISTVALTTAAGTILRPRLGRVADATDSRVADIVATTIGVDTHNHVDVPLTAAEMPGPTTVAPSMQRGRRPAGVSIAAGGA